MVKIITASLASIALLLTATAVNVQAAAPEWDVTGNWDINMEYLGSTYIHDATFTQESDGDLDGTGSSAGGYEWDITSGSVSGNTIQFSANYTAGAGAIDPQTTLIVTGTIATSGTMNGTWSDNFEGGVRAGTWTSSGEVAEEINYAPVLTNVPSSATIPELSLYTFNADASDSDGDSLNYSYSLIGAPTGASISSTTGIFNWTPTEAQGAGVYNFTVSVSDGTASDTAPVTLTVTEVSDSNDAPELTDVPSSATIPELSQYTFNANVSDSDDDTHTFTLIGAPTGASISSTTGVFTWTPTEAQGPGVYNFTVAVSDGTASDTAAVTLTVTEVVDGEEPGNGSTDKDQCKNGGWKTFTSPSFKNQGQCVKHMNHN